MHGSHLNPKDAALRRVGRNIVNYQRWEAGLRALLSMPEGFATPTTARSAFNAKARELKRIPLGSLAQLFQSAIFSSEDNNEPVGDSTEVRLRTAFRLQIDAEFAKQYKVEIMSMVKERNALVHKDLVTLNFESDTECERLSARLDNENARICHQLEFLKEISSMHVEAAQEFLRFINSSEFLKQFNHESGDA